jgi:23S rRNA pseudouridine1911/1915/1917 synthase
MVRQMRRHLEVRASAHYTCGMDARTVTVKKANRLDKALALLLPDLSRSAAQKLIDQGRVQVNGVARDAGHRVKPNDAIMVQLPAATPATPQPEAITLDILYEDDDVIAINKPAGMVAHPGAGNAQGTVVNAVLSYAPEVAGVGSAERPGIVHRLDKETSGVLLIAKHDAALRALQSQFKTRAIKKSYVMLCVGDVQPARGLIRKPIARDPGNRKRMAVVATGRDAITQYAVRDVFAVKDGSLMRRYAYVKANLLTGRTHQLRVHFASLGFPVVGDAVYGARKDPLTRQLSPRQLLHSSELTFVSPSSGAEIKLHAPLPDDFRRVLDALSDEKTA